MPKVDDTTLQQRYQQAKEAWEARQKENRARKRREKARADVRRKTLIAEMVLHHTQTNPHEHDNLMARLDDYLDNPKDRALFDLPPRLNMSSAIPPTGSPFSK